MITRFKRQLSAVYRFLAVIIAVLPLCTGCPSKPAVTDPPDLSEDRRLWKIYRQVMAVKRDAEKTFKNKEITPEEAEACFKRNEAALKDIGRELSELDINKNKAYSPALRRLVNNMDTAIAAARETYIKKRICDVKKTKSAVSAISRLSEEIPRQRTVYLLQAGCSTDQIYEIFREDGFTDEAIQDYILEAMKKTE